MKILLLSCCPLILAMLGSASCGTVCEPGEQDTCTCASGATGVSVCSDSGDSWGECVCDGGDDDAAGDDDTSATSIDFKATVTENPACNISCIVTWTTDAMASSWVEFSQGDEKYRIGDDALTSNHEVIVVGMHAEQTYDLLAYSETSDGETLYSQDLTFTTGALPYSEMVGTVDVYKENLVQPGWTLANLELSQQSGGQPGGSQPGNSPLLAVMWDFTGQPVWYYLDEDTDARIDLQTSWLDDRYVLMGPGETDHPIMVVLAGRQVWKGLEQPSGGGGAGNASEGTYHHLLERMANGQFLSLRTENQVVNNVTVTGDDVVMYNEALDITWSWSPWDHTDVIPLDFNNLSNNNEWTHMNSSFVVVDEGVAYAHSFALSLTFKIDMANGDIIWMFGEDGDFDADPNAATPWPGYAHSIDPLGDGRFLFYDNGPETRGFSRAVIFDLDEDTMQSTVEWEYPGSGVSDVWYNKVGGDADQLDNGNIMILNGSGSKSARIQEVTPDREKVWEMWFDGSSRTSSYQGERMPALAGRITD